MLHIHISNRPEARFTILQFSSDFSPSLAILQTARPLWQLPEFTHLAQEPAQGRPSKVQNLARLADGQVHALEKKKRCSKLSLKQTFLHLSTQQSGRRFFTTTRSQRKHATPSQLSAAKEASHACTPWKGTSPAKAHNIARAPQRNLANVGGGILLKAKERSTST